MHDAETRVIILESQIERIRNENLKLSVLVDELKDKIKSLEQQLQK